MDAFIGEIRAFPYSFIPQGWLSCNGQTYQVFQYQGLAAVISNIYGGTMPTTFSVPNLNGLNTLVDGKVPLGAGQGVGLSPYNVGAQVGAADVNLNWLNFPAHSHTVSGVTGNANTRTAGPSATGDSHLGNHNSAGANLQDYSNGIPNATLASTSVAVTGAVGTIAHNNQSPNLTLTFCICWDGVFPVKAS